MAAPLELPASAFFIFMEEFSETFKHEHPNYKSFAIVCKTGGDKWRSMSPAERGIYEAKAEAEARRTHYIKNIQAYDKKMGKRATSDEDESDSGSDESEEVVDSLPDTVEHRRPASAFFCFMEDFRHTYKNKHPNNKSISAVGKAGGDKWRSLSDAEKAPYVAEAEKRKAEYNKYMDPYCKKMSEVASDEDESDESESDEDNESEEVVNSFSDTVKPKRPASAFFCFMDEFRQTFKNKHPNIKSVSVIGKAGGDKWKSLSDAEKAPYVAEAENRKTEYIKYMDAYSKKTSEGVASDEDESDKSFDSDESDESESDEDNESEEVDRDRPKRPASAYFIFMEKFRQAYKEKHPNSRSVCVVGKAGGDRWKSMSDSEKAPYVAMEKQRKIKYIKYWEAHEKKAVSPWKVRTLKDTGTSLGLSFPFTKKFIFFWHD
ncbi:hypothetical protein MKW92_004346 [Papaver armeniacum]|nr:hypothetical protein MKW92_004346 [Papaver armeniacum]